jgi:putative transposase
MLNQWGIFLKQALASTLKIKKTNESNHKHYRIKDETTAKQLNKMAGAVNYVWNYCNWANKEHWEKSCKTFSAYELHGMTAGCTKELGLHSQTVQAVADQLSNSRLLYKKVKLAWRSRKRHLGWIPFKGSGIKLKDDAISYCGHTFRVWLSRPIEGKVRFGSFCQDAQGHWFVNLVIEDGHRVRLPTRKEVGIDLGLKTIATLSDGNELDRGSLTKKYEEQLAMAQRSGKKRRVTAIHTKIKNKRKDWAHKQTTKLVRDYDRIIVGDVSSSKLIKTRMAKSVSDAGWAGFKTMLAYKAITLGVEVKVVKESFSTVTCSNCKERTGPTGLNGLSVRQWECSACGRIHHRDVNAAMNILLSAQGIVRRRESLAL